MIEMLQEQKEQGTSRRKEQLEDGASEQGHARARAEKGNAPQGCYGTLTKDQSSLDVHAAASHHGHAPGPER
jgi:hypothetical protein